MNLQHKNGFYKYFNTKDWQITEEVLHLRHRQFQYYIWCYIDIPILIARYCKFWKYSYRLHSIWLSLALLLSAFFSLTEHYKVVILDHEKSFDDSVKLHSFIGKTLFALTVIQGFTGIILKSLYISSTELSRFKPNCRTIHGVFGFAMYLLAKIQLYYELDWIGDVLPGQFADTQYWVVGSFTFAIVVVMEGRNFIFRKSRERTILFLDDFNTDWLTSEQSSILKRVKRGETSRNLLKDFPGKKIFIFMNKVIDLTDYIHPGGGIFFKTHNFTEISRYVLGLKPDEKMGILQSHGETAFDIMEFCCLGSAFDPEERDIWNIVKSENFEPVELKNNEFRLGLNGIGGDIFVLRSGNFNLSLGLQGILWIGKFFYLEDENKEKDIVVQISSLVPVYKTYKKALLRKLESYERFQNKLLSLQKDSKIITFGNFLKNSNNLKKSKNSIFSLKGPFGRGLDIPNDFSGRYIIVTKGNGYFPFLDLIDFLLKKTIYIIAEERRDPDLKHSILPRQNYKKMLPGAIFEFYIEVKSVMEIEELETFLKIVELQNELKRKNKNCKILVKLEIDGIASDEDFLPLTEKNFDQRFFENNIDLFGEDNQGLGRKVDKLVVSCDDEDYKRSVAKWCKDLGFFGNKLYFY